MNNEPEYEDTCAMCKKPCTTVTVDRTKYFRERRSRCCNAPLIARRKQETK